MPRLPGQRGEPARFLRDTRGAGLTLAEIRSLLTLRDDGHARCGHVNRPHPRGPLRHRAPDGICTTVTPGAQSGWSSKMRRR
ncbi:MerR family DNA-binding protein [Kitasatospora sp. NPDC059673]|uniref:MerR family DNA-binding protein n=1 Tax=Kitasatospora sp. NPDC059673 TaxID=3346901 RepID=UPI0036AC5C94